MLVILLAIATGESSYAQGYVARKDVQEFMRDMVTKHDFKETYLQSVFAGAVFKQSIINAISRPAEKVLTWKEYRKIFVTDQRIRGGRTFIQKHRKAFRRAEKSYGVPTSIIAAVIGVETLYGRRMGTYRVLDSLATLAFDYPPRAEFFRKQLEEFLLLVREEQQNESELLGSYAGAMGFGQFIPSSYRVYAVDFDADGVRDIWNNPVDAIGSVANYLHAHGWRSGHAIAMMVPAPNLQSQGLFGSELLPRIEVKELRRENILSDWPGDGENVASPLLFNGEQGKEYWLGLYNFYVITRYNHSKLYAMAVYQLSEKLM